MHHVSLSSTKNTAREIVISPIIVTYRHLDSKYLGTNPEIEHRTSATSPLCPYVNIRNHGSVTEAPNSVNFWPVNTETAQL